MKAGETYRKDPDGSWVLVKKARPLARKSRAPVSAKRIAGKEDLKIETLESGEKKLVPSNREKCGKELLLTKQIDPKARSVLETSIEKICKYLKIEVDTDLTQNLERISLELENYRLRIRDLSRTEDYRFQRMAKLLSYGCLDQRTQANEESILLKSLTKDINEIQRFPAWLRKRRIRTRYKETLQRNKARTRLKNRVPGSDQKTRITKSVQLQLDQLESTRLPESVEAEAWSNLNWNEISSPVDATSKSEASEKQAKLYGSLDYSPGAITEGDFFMTNSCLDIENDPARPAVSRELIDLIAVDHVQTQNFSSESRNHDEVDLYIPIKHDGKSLLSLPTLEFSSATHIYFPGIEDCPDLKIFKDALGIIYIEGLPSNVKEIKYRLKVNNFGIEDQLKETMQNNSPQIGTNDFHFFKPGSIESDFIKSNDEHTDMISGLDGVLAQYQPIYTTNPDLNLILQLAPNFYRAQKAMGFIGSCFHHYKSKHRLVQEQGIASLGVQGLVAKFNNRGQLQLQNQSRGHIKLAFVDNDADAPGLEFHEVTRVQAGKIPASSNCFAESLPRLIRALELGEEVFYGQLQKEALHWRQIHEIAESKDFSANSFSNARVSTRLSDVHQLFFKASQQVQEWELAWEEGRIFDAWSINYGFDRKTTKQPSLKQRLRRALIESCPRSEAALTLYKRILGLENEARARLEAEPWSQARQSLSQLDFRDHLTACTGYRNSYICVEELIHRKRYDPAKMGDKYHNFSPRARKLYAKFLARSKAELGADHHWQEILERNFKQEHDGHYKVDKALDTIETLVETNLYPEQVSSENGQTVLSDDMRQKLSEYITDFLKHHWTEEESYFLIQLHQFCAEFNIPIKLSKTEELALIKQISRDELLETITGMHENETSVPLRKVMQVLTFTSSSTFKFNRELEDALRFFGPMTLKEINEALCIETYGSLARYEEDIRDEFTSAMGGDQLSRFLLPLLSTETLYQLLLGNHAHSTNQSWKASAENLRLCQELIKNTSPEQRAAEFGAALDLTELCGLKEICTEQQDLFLTTLESISMDQLRETDSNACPITETELLYELLRRSFGPTANLNFMMLAEANRFNNESARSKAIDEWLESNGDPELQQALALTEDLHPKANAGFLADRDRTTKEGHKWGALSPKSLIQQILRATENQERNIGEHGLFADMLINVYAKQDSSSKYRFVPGNPRTDYIHTACQAIDSYQELEYRRLEQNNQDFNSVKIQDEHKVGKLRGADDWVGIREAGQEAHYRDINWAASARNQSLMVNQRARAIFKTQQEQQTDKHFVLDIKAINNSLNPTYLILQILKTIKDQLIQNQNTSLSICYEGELVLSLDTYELSRKILEPESFYDSLGSRNGLEDLVLTIKTLSEASSVLDFDLGINNAGLTVKYLDDLLLLKSVNASKAHLGARAMNRIINQNCNPSKNSELIIISDEADKICAQPEIRIANYSELASRAISISLASQLII